MTDLWIETTGHRTEFLPGDPITGTVGWSLSHPAVNIELALCWTTRGKGTIDGELIDSMHFENPPSQARRDFRFHLPDAPYTLEGRLVSILWFLRLKTTPRGEETHLHFTMSPTGKAIQLITAR